jgi:copper/silver efflux system protein
MPPGYSVAWSGQFEYPQRAEARLAVVVPLTLALIFLLLYLNFKALTETVIVMLSLPFALVGGIWLMWWMGFNASVAVAVGFIALAGVAAETGVIMLIYLDHAMKEQRESCDREGRAFSKLDLNRAIMVGAVERVRPKMMTVVAIMAGLVPILWRTGTGSEIMQRIAVPMIGGMVSSTLLTLIVIPYRRATFRRPIASRAISRPRNEIRADLSRVSGHRGCRCPKCGTTSHRVHSLKAAGHGG